MSTRLGAQDARDILAAATDGAAQGKAAQIATVRQGLPLADLTVIGIFGPADDLAALLREPSGAIVRVRKGDRAPGGTVAAIGDGAVVLARGGRTQVLRMPAG